MISSGTIIGVGDPRAPMADIGQCFLIFRTNCAILTSFIRADPRTCRGFSRGCFKLRDHVVKVARFSCQFLTAMAGNKAENKNQGFAMYSYALG